MGDHFSFSRLFVLAIASDYVFVNLILLWCNVKYKRETPFR